MNLSRTTLAIMGAITGFIAGVVSGAFGGVFIFAVFGIVIIGDGTEPGPLLPILITSVLIWILVATIVGGVIGYIIGGRPRQQAQQPTTGFLTKAAVLVATALIIIFVGIQAYSMDWF